MCRFPSIFKSLPVESSETRERCFFDMLVETGKICQAVNAIKQLNEKQGEAKKAHKLLEESQSDDLYLHISVKKIPILQHLQYRKIKLPHPVTADLKDVCLLTSNLDKKRPDDEQTIRHYSQVLSDSGISVGQIIPYHQLRTEYKTFEARRHLARAYSAFLNEGSISKMMPVALGTFFIRKKKMPISLSLKPDKVKAEFNRVMSKTTLTMTGRGSSCGVKVGLLSQDTGDLVENVEAVVEYLQKHFPGRWTNVHALNLKTKFSIALPLYISTESPNDVDVPTCQVAAEPVEGEVDTLTRSRVRVYPSGRVQLIKIQADDIDNEIVEKEKKVLSNQRLHKNQKRRLQEKLRIKARIRKEVKAKLKVKETKKKKQMNEKPKKVETPVIKSVFGYSNIGAAVEERSKKKKKKISKEEMSVMITPDKSFQDSFYVLEKKTRSASLRRPKSDEAVELKQIPVQEKASPVQKKRLPRLLSARKSYSMMEKSCVPNGSTELVNFRKREFVEPSETEVSGKNKKVKKNKKSDETNENEEPLVLNQKAEKHKTQSGKAKLGKKRSAIEIRETRGKKKTEKEITKEKKVTRLESIRQSVRMAKGLL